ncbi:MAG: hypothetical protein GY854_18420 [Deltaproteobacteria bacterium]|nr:hypothetical protein [Deltaproteobacteria bacterium]
MGRVFSGIVVLVAVLFLASSAMAQAKKKKKKDTEAEKTVAAAPIVQENTLDGCRDSADNDGDGHVDCDDQDCQIYAICVQAPSVAAVTVVEEEEAVKEDTAQEVPVEERPESGLLCRDGKDNNNDGRIDCHEPSCRRFFYCRQQIYYRPESPNKRPGFYLSLGGGIAFPNFRKPSAEADSTRYGDIPFDPDMGLLANLKLGYFPLKWFGLGMNINVFATAATNEHDYFVSGDDTDDYKYEGLKIGGHVGGFIRFQWPFGRFVPFLDIAGGYSVARYEWQVYDPANSWDDIDTWGNDSDDDYYNEWDLSRGIIGDRDTHRFVSRHFTFALQPGFDVFVVKRMFAIGMSAWLPVIASNDSSTDNIGVMLHFTVTPMWRERRRIKPEYEVDEHLDAEVPVDVVVEEGADVSTPEAEASVPEADPPTEEGTEAPAPETEAPAAIDTE